MNPTYSPRVLPLMQSLLATLADLDFAHEHELEQLQASSVNETLKVRLRAQHEARHRERREPYVRELRRLEAVSPLECLT